MFFSCTSSEVTSDGIIVYRERWWVLTVFALLVMANALLWVTFAPISDLTQTYFHKNSSYGSTTSVNMLANIFLVLYAPGSILNVVLVKYFRPRNTVLFAGTLNALGALLRYIGTSYFNEIGNASTYGIVFLGQTFGAIAQPTFLNFPPALASIWFPTHEREIATTIGSMCSPIGNAIGQLISVNVVVKTNVAPEDDDVYDVSGMSDLMLVEFILCVVPLVAAFFIFKDAPATPPSQSTKLKVDRRNTDREQQPLTAVLEEGDGESSPSQRTQSNKTAPYDHRKSNASTLDSTWALVKRETILLSQNKAYIILFSVFSIGVGFFNSILTLLNQLVQPFGYSNDDAGTFGAVFIVAGLVGAGIAGKILETTKAYKTSLKVGITLCVLAITFMLLMLFSNNFWPLCVAFGIMGFFVLPLLPIMLENCAECTYPVAEELSSGFLFAGCNILGLGFIFAIQYLIDVPRFAPPPFLPSNFFILGVVVVAALLLIFYDPEYKRLKHEKKEHPEESPQVGESPNTHRPTVSDGLQNTDSDNDLHLVPRAEMT